MTRLLATLVFLLASAIAVTSAIRQQSLLNLSATAGGQYPYLIYAQGMAQEGWWNFFGDRNRMPLVPALVSLGHTDDWTTFVERSAWLSIGLTIASSLVVFLLALRSLKTWPAVALWLMVWLVIFAPYASFVQAEIPYYALFLACWLLSCRVIVHPTIGLSLSAGALIGATYLTKASALPLLWITLAFLLIRALVDFLRSRKQSPSSTSPGVPPRPQFVRFTMTGLSVLIGFVLLCAPYLVSNYNRFGHVFYNVNSTYFMWCDSWQDARAFAEKHDIARRTPDARPEEIPSLTRYLSTHSLSQMFKRLGYGANAMIDSLWDHSITKYLILSIGVAGWTLIRRQGALRQLWREHRWPMSFTACTLLAYGLSYAWYAQVAFGERFVLSLVLPVLWIFLWIATGPRNLEKPEFPATNSWFSAILIAGALIESVLSLTAPVSASPGFVSFYYNESRERELANDFAEAERGYRGVLQLAADFAPAHQSLGMIALTSGRIADAELHLARAAQLLPSSADAANSYGSALVQSGKIERAIVQFENAVRLSSRSGVFWFNLGGSYITAGRLEDALAVIDVLKAIDPERARQLSNLLHTYRAPSTSAP